MKNTTNSELPAPQKKINDLVNAFLQRQLVYEMKIEKTNPDLAKEMRRTTSVIAEFLLRSGGVYKFNRKLAKRKEANYEF